MDKLTILIDDVDALKRNGLALPLQLLNILAKSSDDFVDSLFLGRELEAIGVEHGFNSSVSMNEKSHMKRMVLGIGVKHQT
ncbi:hypothetical protein CYG48_05875 [Neorhizobium sp. SOG26]|uniref:hypothetical protein n=1 Tax=Neorhizobium sp. SOG26 TaxID=2060726 RepID=UPI000E58D8C7|nr:hypothetical protein [Neorhizobium sp. SOG26]AXV15273.1 hypothetical protein CYG48_05875 [Neorhizobium sp. SOG26]